MRILSMIALVLVTMPSTAQKKVLKRIEAEVTGKDAGAHISFLAADQMRGRNTGSPELDIAANYIATQFKLYGVKSPPALKGYFQDVELQKIMKPTTGKFLIDTSAFNLGKDLLFVSGSSIDKQSDIVFAGYGSNEDFEKVDVKGKVVVVYAGAEGKADVGEALITLGPEKQSQAYSRGAIALVEIFAIPGVPWQGISNFLSGQRLSMRPKIAGTIPHLWLRNSTRFGLSDLLKTKMSKGQIEVKVNPPIFIHSNNVIGVIEGTDPKLKKEWIAVSAHYDHVGVRRGVGDDSIYNGARDNAIGTVAVLESARYFSRHPPKRSIAFIALTAEEVGLLGSAWYAEHPVIPLKQTVFNFNCDGAGYNDTTLISVIDLNRTSTDQILKKAALSQGLVLKGDPAPEQKLYDRSDNANFAMKGVPAVNISPGIKAFDQELFKYYHQPADEYESLNMHYLQRFYRSFVYALYLLSAEPTKPTWKAGDKYEQAGKALYGM
ncbi:MAG: M28 family peptidase [Chryseolinea sp.]